MGGGGGEIAGRVDGHERTDSHFFLEGHRKHSLLSINPKLIFLKLFFPYSKKFFQNGTLLTKTLVTEWLLFFYTFLTIN